MNDKGRGVRRPHGLRRVVGWVAEPGGPCRGRLDVGVESVDQVTDLVDRRFGGLVEYIVPNFLVSKIVTTVILTYDNCKSKICCFFFFNYYYYYDWCFM
jgi:hypothetical protein